MLGFLAAAASIASAGLSIWGAYEKKKAAEKAYSAYKKSSLESLKYLRESYALSINELERYYKQIIAQSYDVQRETVGNVQAYFGARGVEFWGSAVQKGMDAINKLDRARQTLYTQTLLQKRRLDIGLKSKNQSILTGLETQKLRADLASKQFWLTTAGSLLDLGTKYGKWG